AVTARAADALGVDAAAVEPVGRQRHGIGHAHDAAVAACTTVAAAGIESAEAAAARAAAAAEHDDAVAVARVAGVPGHALRDDAVRFVLIGFDRAAVRDEDIARVGS